MITFFTTGKAFGGHSAVIQRNALLSWKRLDPNVEVVLFGDDDGAGEAARDLGIRHEPEVARNPIGLPYINSIFDRAEEIASHDVLCYINCDIILTADFLEALARVRKASANFLMVGRRWDADIAQPLDFANPRWQESVREIAARANDQRDAWWIDYFAFPRGFYAKKIPQFAVTRCSWDNWLVWKAISSGALVVDASASVLAIHQNHGYSYHPMGKVGVWTDEYAQRNLALAGGWKHLRTIADAKFRLTPDGIEPNRARYWHGTKRTVQLAYGYTKRDFTHRIWLPAWHRCLDLTRPLRARLGLRSRAARQAQASRKESPRAGVPS
jgi:hypothetical protein